MIICFNAIVMTNLCPEPYGVINNINSTGSAENCSQVIKMHLLKHSWIK